MTDVDRPPVRWWRLTLLATLIVAVFAVGRATGLSTYLSTERYLFLYVYACASFYSMFKFFCLDRFCKT
jgi:hypothetical protein